MTFRRQLILAFSVLLGVVALTAILLLGRLGGVDDARQHIADSTAPYTTSLAAASTDMKAMANDERGYLMTGDTEFRDEIGERADTIRGELADARKAAPEPADAAAVDAIAAKFEGWAEAVEAEFALFSRDRAAAIDASLGANRDLRKAYEADLKDAREDAEADLARSLAEVETNASGARTALLVALLVLAA
ncbi:MAG TPA: CHASE3 domain-containing protein, partial [Beijerinckiaceae bacterium]